MSNSMQPTSSTSIGEDNRHEHRVHIDSSGSNNAPEEESTRSETHRKPVLVFYDVAGMIKPCRMILLLGLGVSASEEKTLFTSLERRFLKKNEGVARVSKNDAHHGELTVRETLKFAAKCQGVMLKRGELIEVARRKKEANILDKDEALMQFIEALEATSETEEMLPSLVATYLLKVLGLEDCADKKVGSNDEMTNGISRGQRRLLSIGEVLAGPSTIFLIEESSIGLDIRTSSNLVNCLRNRVNDVQGASVISLLDPPPESYEHFDDVILLGERLIVSQDARKLVLEFFEHCGFNCPMQMHVTDFLREVTSKQTQKKYWARREKPYAYMSLTAFATRFQEYDAAGEGLNNEMCTKSDRSKSHPTSSISDAFKLCIHQNFLLMWMQSDLALKTLLSILSVFVSLIFRKPEMPGDNQKDAFVVLVILSFVATSFSNGIPDIDHILLRLPVFFKQRDLHFFPVWIYCSSIWILELMVVLVQIAIWNLIFLVAGFDSHVLRLLKWNLPLLLLMLMASALLRLIASFVRRKILASNIWLFLLSLANILHKFAEVTVRDNWAWAHWLSPTVYGQNEYCSGVQDEKIYWRVAGILFGFYMLFNFLDYLALYSLLMPKTELARETAGKREPKISGASASVETSSGAENPRTPFIRSNNDLQDRESRRLPSLSPLSIAFTDIRYVVNVPPEMKHQGLHEGQVKILEGVSGDLKPGVLTALMDVSKKGNTTLMDVLSGRITGGHLQASIKVSGRLVDQETLSRISGYCGQEDIHSPYITVLETLQFTASLHLDPTTENIEQKIHTVMELVELTSLKGEIVGSAGVNGISIEQRKRLTFAVILLTTQSVFFIDEPTSGLDARASTKVMTIIRKISKTDCIVVCTIHQPSIDVLQTFDELILLQEGRQIYAGPLGQECLELIKHFKVIDKDSEIGEASNLAAWVERMVPRTSQDNVHHYNKSESGRANNASIKQRSTRDTNSEVLLPTNCYRPPFPKQCMTCLRKQSLSYWRNRDYNLVRFVMAMVEALVVGVTFRDLGSNRGTEQDILNAIESLFLPLLYTGMRNAATVQQFVATERAVFFQERAPGTLGYSLSFAFGQAVIELQYVLLQTLIQGVIVYFLIGFERTATKFLWYWFFMFLNCLCSTYCGMMLVAVIPNIKKAKIVCNAICNIWYLFSGFIFTEPLSLSKFVLLFWYSTRYLVQYGLVSSQFGDCKDKLSSGKTVEEFIRSYYGYSHEYVPIAAALILVMSMFFASIFAVGITVSKLRKI